SPKAHRLFPDAPQRCRIFRHCLHDQFRPRRMTKGTILAERTYRAVDHFRVCPLQPGVSKPDSLSAVHAEILNQHICSLCQLHGRLAAVRGLEIEHDTLFVAIEAEEDRTLVALERRSHAPREVTCGRFNLDDLGSAITELHRAERATESLRK